MKSFFYLSEFLPSRRVLKILCVIVVLIFIIPCARFATFLAFPSGSGGKVRIIDIREGSSLKKIAGELQSSGIISSELLFVLYARARKADGAVKAGAYLFDDGMTPQVILRKLLDGDVYIRRFAVPEGYSIYQIAELLERREIFSRDEFLTKCTDPALLAALGIKGASVEGYLQPSTYDITPGLTPEGLVREMVAQFNRLFAREFEARSKSRGMSTGEILTLASMIEKEAVVPEERPLIASVFFNRLRKGMPLQSDPTAVYKIRAFAGRISKKDIMFDSPYNTYKIQGLPPGPIGNPGREAIEAVLNPARTNYLYFVARMDGTHHFSVTLDEHNLAVRKYLKSRSAATEGGDADPKM